MSLEICHCPRCKAGDEAPHEYHLERRPMPSDYVCAACRTPLAAGYTCHVCGCEEAEDADGVHPSAQTVAQRAADLHEKAGMPLDQARELATSEAGITPDNQWFGDMMILQVLADSEHVNEQEREVLTRWMAASQPPGVLVDVPSSSAEGGK